MRYKLRALLSWAAIAPLLIALAYWTIEFVLEGRLRFQVYLAFVALSGLLLHRCLARAKSHAVRSDSPRILAKVLATKTRAAYSGSNREVRRINVTS
jgi:hypothetical protein